MSDLKNILNEEYEKKNSTIDVKTLLEMIEGILDTPLPIIKEYSYSGPQSSTVTVSMIPDIEVSELGWSDLRTPDEQGADWRPTERQLLEHYLDNIVGQGGMSMLPEKLDVLSELADNPAVYIDGIQDADLGTAGKLSKVISFLVFYKTLTKIIANFNASSAGFSFESFLATLLGGEQIPASGAATIADFIDQDQVPVSLKLYRESGVEVGGSFDALVGDILRDGSMTYLVVTKDLRGSRENMSGTLKFYQFEFNLDNILDIVARTKAFSARCAILPFAEAQEGEEAGLQDIRDEEGNIVTDIEKVRFTPQAIQDQYAANLADKLAAKAGQIGWAGPQRYLSAIPFPTLSMEEIVDNPFFDYTKEEQSYIATDSPGKPFPAAGVKRQEMIDQLRTVPSVEAGEGEIAQLVPERYAHRTAGIINVFLKVTANLIRQAHGEVLEDYLERRGARTQRVQALDIPKYSLPTRDDKAEEKAAKIAAIQDAALRSATWYSLQEDPAVKRAALMKTNGYLNDLQFSLGKSEVLSIATRNTIGQEGADNEAFAVPSAKGDSLGALEIGMGSLQVMLDKCIAALNTDIFSIFKDLEELSTSLNTFFAKGLAGTEANNAAETAIDRADAIEGKTKEAKSNK